MCISVTGLSQIDLIYTAEYNGAYIELDSILIKNLSQGCDTILYYPDTVLSIILTGLVEKDQITENGLILNQNYPNPFSEATTIDLFLSKEDKVEIQVFDCLGKQVTSYNGHLMKGWHSFELESCKSVLYFLSAATSIDRKTINLTYSGRPRDQRCKIQYLGISPKNRSHDLSHNKAIQSGFNLNINDHLRYYGYASQNSIAGNDRLEDTLISSDNFVFEINGLPCPYSPTVIDIESNTYNTVLIGNQCWMAENLNVTKYSNNASIPMVSDNMSWDNLANNGTDDAYCYYNNNSNGESNKYGALYNWAAAMGDNAVSSNSNPSGVQGICPDGWHLPSDDEWKELEMALGMSQTEADQTGERGTNEGSQLAANASLWINSSLENDAEFGTSGFLAIPGGTRNDIGEFINEHSCIYFWTATEDYSWSAWSRGVGYNTTQVSRHIYSYKSLGHYVRCVKDY